MSCAHTACSRVASLSAPVPFVSVTSPSPSSLSSLSLACVGAVHFFSREGHSAILVLVLRASNAVRSISTVMTASTAEGLEARALNLCARINALEPLPGATRLLARTKSELVDMREASTSRLAGAANNLCAIEWELDVCAWAPEVVALAHTSHPPSLSPTIVDVVGAGGKWWLEAKASLPFGLGSTAWADLTQQLARLTANAQSSLSGVHRPRVLVVFRHQCPEEVNEALLRLGVTPVVADDDGQLPDPSLVAASIGGVHSPKLLLRPPPLLLDVSSLLCLLSSSCRPQLHGTARLREWAASNEHWSRSLDEEAEAPLLPTLSNLLRCHRPWMARRAEVDKCEALVSMAGGAAEKRRWDVLRGLLLIIDSATAESELLPRSPGGGGRSETASADQRDPQSPDSQAHGESPPPEAKQLEDLRRSLTALSAAHRALLVDAAAADALLCTANGRLVRRVPEHVHLRCHVHQARWLVGDALPLTEEEDAQLNEDPMSLLGLGR